MNPIPVISSQFELKCPACGSINLHHGTVRVFSRGEDAPKTVVTEVTPDHSSAPTKTTIEITAGQGNPSARRHGLTLAFWCEGCHGTFELTIAQHKGVTLVEW